MGSWPSPCAPPVLMEELSNRAILLTGAALLAGSICCLFYVLLLYFRAVRSWLQHRAALCDSGNELCCAWHAASLIRGAVFLCFGGARGWCRILVSRVIALSWLTVVELVRQLCCF